VLRAATSKTFTSECRSGFHHEVHEGHEVQQRFHCRLAREADGILQAALSMMLLRFFMVNMRRLRGGHLEGRRPGDRCPPYLGGGRAGARPCGSTVAGPATLRQMRVHLRASVANNSAMRGFRFSVSFRPKIRYNSSLIVTCGVSAKRMRRAPGLSG
jgi:hypothetical protein